MSAPAAKPRALVVFPCTVEGFAGNIARLAQVVQLLADSYEIHFFSLVQASGVEEALREKGLRVDRVGMDAPVALERALRFAYKVVYVLNRIAVEKLRVRTHYAFGAFDHAARLLLRLFHVTAPYDLAVFNYVWTARGLRALCRRCAVDMHDLHANRHEKLGYRNWVSLAGDDELARLAEADAVIAISEQEHDALSSRAAGIRSVFLPFWPGSARPSTKIERSPRCVFVGSGNALNVRSLKTIETTGIMLALQRLGLTLSVVGAVCESEVAKGLARRWPDVIELKGIVPDVQAFLASCTVGFNTCGPSTGLKVKTVEYLASGLHVIVTPDGSDPWLNRVFATRIQVIDVAANASGEAELEVTRFLERVHAGRHEEVGTAETQVRAQVQQFLAVVRARS